MMSISKAGLAGLSRLDCSFSTTSTSTSASAASSPLNSPRFVSLASLGARCQSSTSVSAASSPNSSSAGSSPTSSSGAGFSTSRKRRSRPQSMDGPLHKQGADEDNHGDNEVQATISRRQGGKRVKAAKHPSPQRKQQAISISIQPTEKATSIRVSPSSAFSSFVPSSTVSLPGVDSSRPSSAAVLSSLSISPAYSTRSLSILSSTSTSTTLTKHSPSSLPLITPSSALASSLSSFTFDASFVSSQSLPSMLECREELDDGKSSSQHDEDEYVLVDKKEAHMPNEETEKEPEDEEDEDEYDDESEGDADDEGEEALSDDDTVGATAASPATTSSLPTSVSTGQSCSSSSASNPSPCPLPSALITSYYAPDPRAYTLSLSRSTDTITTIASILEPLDPDLLAHMFDTEQLYHPLHSYMQHQPHLEPAMRPVLLDWMIEVSQEFGLQRETTELAANFVDRFLTVCPASLYPPLGSTTVVTPVATSTSTSPTNVSSSSLSPAAASPVSLPITRLNFQLLGITSLFLASKLEEIYPPTANDFATTTDGAYCTAHIASMERLILDKLQWRLQAVTPFAWCKALLKCACRNVSQWVDDEVKRVERRMEERGRERLEELERLDERLAELEVLKSECISYLLSVDLFTRCMEFVDATLLDVRFLSFYPSALASAAMLLVYSSPPASICLDLMLATTTYSLSSLLPAIHMLSMYSGMEWRGVVKGRSYFSASEGKERVEERWSRQTHWDGMIEWKEQVEHKEREPYKVDAEDDAERNSDLDGDDDEDEGGRGGCVEVCESSLSSYGASGVGLTSSLASTSEWSTLDSELDRREC